MIVFLFITNTVCLKSFARCMFKTFWSGYGSRVKKPSPSHRKNCASMLRIVKVFCATFAITMLRNARVFCAKMAGSAGESPGGGITCRYCQLPVYSATSMIMFRGNKKARRQRCAYGGSLLVVCVTLVSAVTSPARFRLFPSDSLPECEAGYRQF